MTETNKLDYDPTSPDLPDNYEDLSDTDKGEILFLMKKNGQDPAMAIQNYMVHIYGSEERATGATIAELSRMLNFFTEKFDS